MCTVSNPPPPPPPSKLQKLTEATVSRWKSILTAIVYALSIPYFAHQHMQQRIAEEKTKAEQSINLKEIQLDDQVPDLKLVVSDQDWMGQFKFGDGTLAKREAYGLAVLTWQDYQNHPAQLDQTQQTWKSGDFPVVVTFNRTAFDVSGNPDVVYRVSDGHKLYSANPDIAVVRAMVPRRDANFGVLDETGKLTSFSEDVWYRDYMQLDTTQPAEQPAAGETPPSPQPSPSASTEPQKLTAPVDFEGRVIQVGDTKEAVKPMPGVKLVLLPAAALAGAAFTDSDEQGRFKFQATPGDWVLVALQDGKLVGNAYDGSLPHVIIPAEGLKDYEFRLFKRPTP